MTLHLSFGDRTGMYSGELDENGLPHGQGKFTTTNSEGEKWSYEGEFKNGHFDGEGKQTWESGQVHIGTYKNDEIIPLKDEEIKTLYTNPDSFKDHFVEVVGLVFTTPEYMDNGVCFQMVTDIENHDNNTIVYVFDTEFKVKEKDYVKIVGCVEDVFVGENAFGGEVTAPTIDATEYEIINYIDAVSPTLKTAELNQTQTQHGYSITVQKIEYAEKETRVYVKIHNQGSDTFNVYSFNTKITQNGKQFEEQQDNYDADYPEIQNDLLVGNTTEGIIAFPVLDTGNFTLQFEGRSDNWDEDFKPFVFQIEQ